MRHYQAIAERLLIGDRAADVDDIAAREPVASLLRHATGRHEGFAAWTLLFYALWHRTHVLGLPAPHGGAADVFETLATR